MTATGGRQQPEFRLYVDYMSQPSRAVVIFARLHGLPVEEVQTLIHKGQHKSPEYLARNPLGTLPFMEAAAAGSDDAHPQQHDGAAGGMDEPRPFRCMDSAAIMTYLCTVYSSKVPAHWYPQQPAEARAHVDAALHWHHSNTRAGAMRLVFHRVLAQRLKVPPQEELAREGLTILRRALPALQSVWLAEGRKPFIGGTQPCLADLQICCELEQLTLIKKGDERGVDMDVLLEPYPVIRRWMAATAAATAPHYEQVHALLRRSAATSGGSTSPAQQTPAARL